MIPAHQELSGRAGLIERDAPYEAVLQHGTGPPVLLHPGAQDEDTVGAQGGGLLRGDNGALCLRFYIQIDQRQRKAAGDKEAKEKQKPFFQARPPFIRMDKPPILLLGTEDGFKNTCTNG